MIQTLHGDAFFRVELEPRDGVVKVTRSGQVLPTPDTEEPALRAVAAAIGDAPRPRLLVDLRHAPSGDGEEEALRLLSMLRVRPERVALLVTDGAVAQSAAGSAGAHVAVFTSEDSAFDWVLA